MISTVCFSISIFCFVSSFGCHTLLKNGSSINWAAYLMNPFLSMIPGIGGFILAVIPESIIFDIAWYWMFLINAICVTILSPIIAHLYLLILSSGKGYGMDAFISFAIGIISFIIGIIV